VTSLDAGYVSELNKMLRWWRAQLRSTSGSYPKDLRPLAFLFRRFELKGELRPGGAGVQAYHMPWDGSALNTDLDTIFTVYDATEGRRARGRDSMDSGQFGAFGWAIKPHDGANQPADPAGTGDAWEIVEIQEAAALIKVSNDYSGHTAVAASATFTGVLTTPLGPGIGPVTIGDPVTGIKNYSTGIPDNAVGIVCVWDPTENSGDGGWLVIDAPCP
jgi:hypothetical protein